MATKYIKSSAGRDYNYDRARGSYSTTFIEQQKRIEKRRKTLLQKDTDDHGRFSANPDPAVWGPSAPAGEG